MPGVQIAEQSKQALNAQEQGAESLSSQRNIVSDALPDNRFNIQLSRKKTTQTCISCRIVRKKTAISSTAITSSHFVPDRRVMREQKRKI
jgi:hypothetical protein